MLTACSAPCADQAHTLPGVKIARAPVIDGVVDLEKEWAGAPSGTGFVDMETGGNAPVETKFWLAYDDKFVYFAAKLSDPDPKSIKATEYRTNVSLTGDDSITVYLDPFGNLAEVNSFAMNCRGATNVYVAGGRAAKREWLGEFVAKGRTTADGWEVEARIPWAIMSLPSAGRRTLRFNVSRYYSRNQRYSNWCYLVPNPENMGKWADVEVPRSDRSRTLKLLPFGYLGAVDAGNGIFDGGLDLKTSLTDRAEFVGSIKPDFRNIENQILSLDFSHFERIADESRPFFMEGGDYFSLGGDEKIFITQAIPDFDVGAKAYGKLDDKTSFGVLNMTTLGEWNAFVGSATHAIDNVTQIQVGATSYDKPGQKNETGMLFAQRQFGPLALYDDNMWSFDEVRGEGRRNNAGFFFGQDRWQAYGEYVEVSPDFDPAIGYSPEQNLKGVNGSLGYTAVFPHTSLSEESINLFGVNYQNFDDTHYRSQFSATSSTAWKSGTQLVLTGYFDRFGGIDERLFTASVVKPRGDPYRFWSAGATYGSILGQTYLSPTLAASYRPIQKLQTDLRYQVVDNLTYTDQVILTANYDMGNDNGISGRIVKQGDNWNAFVAYRRSGNMGNEYYLILGDPNALSFHASLILKVTIPFDLRF